MRWVIVFLLVLFFVACDSINMTGPDPSEIRDDPSSASDSLTDSTSIPADSVDVDSSPQDFPFDKPYIPVFKGPRFFFSTKGTDAPHSLAEAPNGDILIGGTTEGVTAPTDGTLSKPLFLRIRPDASLVDSTVYRPLGYGRVDFLSTLGGQSDVLIYSYELSIPGYSTINRGYKRYAVGPGGELQSMRVNFEYSDTRRNSPILLTAEGNVLLDVTYPGSRKRELTLVSNYGATRWVYNVPEWRQIFGVSESREGDIVFVTPGNGGQFRIIRLDGRGVELSSHVHGDLQFDSTVRNTAAFDDGVVVLGNRRHPSTNEKRMFITRYSNLGDEMWDISSPDWIDHFGEKILPLPSGGAIVAWTQFLGWDIGRRSGYFRISAFGEIVWMREFEPNQGTAAITELLLLSSNQLVVAGFIGPGRLGGYGGDPLDIVVHIDAL